eukprot:TRINITY_DN4618_c0_g2_i2.p1 TRINITY_DN4618_c0_g2~~TRINITY_DN4618_c0_g2_i2.p1  ORF type:complete len:268 (-),score=31.78 TRINITY_DN4618_c0_g2_i2:46-810(-)
MAAHSSNRESLVFFAQLAEQAERHEEMVNAMKAVAKLGIELTVTERNLFSVAYKNIIGSRRAAWRILSSIESKEVEKNLEKIELESRALQVKEYREKIENELTNICNEVLSIIDNYLLKHTTYIESKAFFLKMKGDYLRYMAEYSTADLRKEVANKALASYNEAINYFQGSSTTNPIRLGLVLNFSVFIYEILNNPSEACAFAKKAFDEAISGLDRITEESYKDATLILQLIRDNITLWSSSEDDQNGTHPLEN